MRPTTRAVVIGATVGVFAGLLLTAPGDLWRWAAFAAVWLVLRRDWRDTRADEATLCPFHHHHR